jgi:large subunit ribosomal protein L17
MVCASPIGARRRAARRERPRRRRGVGPMRHRKAGRSLRRTSEQRLALLRNLATSLIEQGAIETTEAKAKELRPFVEKLITKARRGTLHARRLAGIHVQKREAPTSSSRRSAPRTPSAAGGYTRILKTGTARVTALRWRASNSASRRRLLDPVRLEALGTDSHPARRSLDQHTDGLEVRVPATLLPVVGVTDVVASHRPLLADGAHPGHTKLPSRVRGTVAAERAHKYNRLNRLAQLRRVPPPCRGH